MPANTYLAISSCTCASRAVCAQKVDLASVLGSNPGLIQVIQVSSSDLVVMLLPPYSLVPYKHVAFQEIIAQICLGLYGCSTWW